MRRQGLHQRFGHVVQQMPAVRNLHSLRRGCRRRLGIEAGPVPADDLCSGMRSKPLRCALCAAVRQQIYNLALLKVAENRSVPVPFTPRPIIDSQHSNGMG